MNPEQQASPPTAMHDEDDVLTDRVTVSRA